MFGGRHPLETGGMVSSNVSRMRLTCCIALVFSAELAQVQKRGEGAEDEGTKQSGSYMGALSICR